MPPQQQFTQATRFQEKQPQPAIQSQSRSIFDIDFSKVRFTPIDFTPTPMSAPFNSIVNDSKKNYVAQEFKPYQSVAELKKVEPVKIREKE